MPSSEDHGASVKEQNFLLWGNIDIWYDCGCSDFLGNKFYKMFKSLLYKII